MSESTALPKACESALREAGLMPGRDRVVVGVSGGCDSMTLLRLVDGIGFSGTVAHVNHGFRGEESEGDEAFVRQTAEAMGWKIAVDRPTLPPGNRQDRARTARRKFMESVRVSTGSTAILLAHHQDDQLETILLQIHRGGRPDTLRGMDPVSGAYVRPLLDVPGAAIRAFAEESGTSWREDRSNADTRYLRNRIRLKGTAVSDRERLLKLAGESRYIARFLDSLLAAHSEGPTLDDSLFLNPETDIVALAVHRFARRAGIRVSDEECGKLFLTTAFRPGKKIGPFVRENAGWSLIEPAPGAIGEPDGWILRRWLPGDRLDGRKVSDLMSDGKWPHRDRLNAMVRVGPDGRIASLIRPIRNG